MWSNARHGSQSRASSPTHSFPDDPGYSLTPEALKAMTEDDDSSASDGSNSCRAEQAYVSENDSQQTPRATGRGRRTDHLVYPRIECTLGILYLACLRLRLPIIMQDLIK